MSTYRPRTKGAGQSGLTADNQPARLERMELDLFLRVTHALGSPLRLKAYRALRDAGEKGLSLLELSRVVPAEPKKLRYDMRDLVLARLVVGYMGGPVFTGQSRTRFYVSMGGARDAAWAAVRVLTKGLPLSGDFGPNGVLFDMEGGLMRNDAFPQTRKEPLL